MSVTAENDAPRSSRLRHPDPSTTLAWNARRRWQAPLWVKLALIGAFLAGFIPLAFAIRARVDTRKDARIHPIQDMDNQPKFKAQDFSNLFADGRSNRPPVPGAVARGELGLNAHFELGYVMRPDPANNNALGPQFFNDFPPEITVNEAFIRRGQQIFGINCSVCHGKDGRGGGPIHVQAVAGGSSAWVPPTDLHSDQVRVRPNGHIYNTINNGIRSMAPYGTQIDAADRWAVVAYVRALQLSDAMPANLLTEEQRRRLQ